MEKILKYFPELVGSDLAELNYVKETIKGWEDESIEFFAAAYRIKRRDPQTVLLLCVAGVFVLPGLQRFYLNQIGMGILYLLTLGLCLIGSIVDLIKYKELALEYNTKLAQEIALTIQSNQ